LLVYFDTDDALKRILIGMNRFRRIPVEALAAAPIDVEQIIMVTREAQVEVHYNLMRKPKVRVIAIADKRFRDPRNDGAVYAYLPTIASGDLIERMVDNAIDHIQLLHNR